MGRYRSSLDIIGDMLNVISKNDSTTKTQIMYQSNLSYKLLIKYLNQVIESCLIRFERKGKCYIITSKGKKFLENYKKYSRRSKQLEKRLNNLADTREVLEKLCSNT